MSGENADAGPRKKAGNGNGRGKMLFGIFAFFLLCGAGWGAYWLFFLAGSQSTDNAYVAGNQIRISARVAGNVATIKADNHQLVEAGQILLTLDDTDARVALARAKAALADAVRRTSSLMAESDRLQAVISVRESELAKAEGDLARRRKQRTALSVSEEELQHARDDHATAVVALREAREALQVNKMLLQEAALEEQPQVLLAAEETREAWLALERCAVKSPATGYVARRSAQVGMHVTPDTPLMAVVPLDQVWVDANFKEVQLKSMRMGQKATVKTDMYGGSVEFTGTVAGFSAGTGSSFSLLPPENATGNWIKVVQRVPVKIALDSGELAKNPLLVGLSCLVAVDVSDAAGPMLALDPVARTVFSTDSLAHDLGRINDDIAAIVEANKGPAAKGRGR